MKLKHQMLAILFLAMLLGSCEDNHTTNPTQNKPPTEEQLPPITTTGAGTFGCKVNGKVWVAKSNTSWPHIYFSFDRTNRNAIGINGYIRNKEIDFLQINIRWYHNLDSSINNYSIGYTNSYTPSGGYIDVNENNFWRTDSLRGGKVELLRFDSLNQIISGTFNFDCINKETGDVLKITEGRFDMHYTY